MQPKKGWWSPQKLKIELPYDPASPLGMEMKEDTEETPTLTCSLQLWSQQLRRGVNMNGHQ
jgi:hypothetical protein